MSVTRIFDLLDRYITVYPGHQVLGSKVNGNWQTYTSEDYYEIAHDLAYGLLDLGLAPGDKVITITNNRPEWNFLDMAIAMSGAVHVPVYTSLSEDEYRYIFDHSDACMVFAGDSKLYERAQKAASVITELKGIFTLDEVEGARNWKEIRENGRNRRDTYSEELQKRKEAVSEFDLASLIYTSGTTGTSKGVMLSHRNIVSNFLAAADIFNLTPSDRYLSILPLCHVGGRMGNYQTQYSGSTIYYAESMGTIAKNMKELEANGFDAVPRILEKVFDTIIANGNKLTGFKRKLFFWAVELGLRYQPFGANGLLYELKLRIADKLIFSKWRAALGGNARIVGCGGASLQPRLERIFWAAGVKILNMYGLTETSPIITINRQDKPLVRLGSVGALISGVEVKIANDGEILCRGDNVMMGYYKDEALTKTAMDEEGWFHTGDIGEIEDGTFLKVTDRKKEIFKLSNGKFIAPQVIENLIKEIQGVEQVMVVGEHEKFASAILVPATPWLNEFCKTRTLPTGSAEEMVCIPEVQQYFRDEINRLNRKLSEPEKVLRIRLVADEWSPSTGELSPTLKLKRSFLRAKYSQLLESIYLKQAV